MIFDTLAFAKRFKEVGFTEAQAEELTEALRVVMVENLATKQDVADVRQDIKDLEGALRQDISEVRQEIKTVETTLRQEIKAVETSLRQDISEVRQEIKGVETALRQEINDVRQEVKDTRKDLEVLGTRLTLRLGGLIVAGVGILAVLVKVL